MSLLQFEFLAKVGLSLNDYDGRCYDLCQDVLGSLRNNGSSILAPPPEIIVILPKNCQSLYPSTFPYDWVYHAILTVDDYVHDPWFGLVESSDRYAEDMFPAQEIYFLTEKEFNGHCSQHGLTNEVRSKSSA